MSSNRRHEIAYATNRIAGRKAVVVRALIAGGITDWRILCGLSGMKPSALRNATAADLDLAAMHAADRHYPIRGEVRCKTCRGLLIMVPCLTCQIEKQQPVYEFRRFTLKPREEKEGRI